MEQMGAIDFWKQSPEKQIEELRRFGEGYRAIIHQAIGTQSSVHDSGNDRALKRITEGASAFASEQMRRQTEKGLSAPELLKQVFHSAEQQALIDTNGEAMRLETVSPGIFAVHVHPRLMYQLRPGAQSVAVKSRDGVSFLLLQDLQGEENAGYAEKYQAENVPHEAHHLIWAAVVNAGAFPSREADQDFVTTFQIFRDELMARAVSDGGLAGYTHIHSLSPEARAELEAQSPGKADRIIEKVAALNGLLHELNGAIAKSERVSKIDLLKIAVDAKTLDELEDGIKKLHALCDYFPRKEESPASGSGWTSVST